MNPLKEEWNQSERNTAIDGWAWDCKENNYRPSKIMGVVISGIPPKRQYATREEALFGTYVEPYSRGRGKVTIKKEEVGRFWQSFEAAPMSANAACSSCAEKTFYFILAIVFFIWFISEYGGAKK